MCNSQLMKLGSMEYDVNMFHFILLFRFGKIMNKYVAMILKWSWLTYNKYLQTLPRIVYHLLTIAHSYLTQQKCNQSLQRKSSQTKSKFA